jgi:hypothetical protein
MIPDGDSTRAVGGFSRVYRQFVVSDGYFNLLGLKIRNGRGFGPAEIAGGPSAAIISAAAAKAMWGTVSPIGHTVNVGGIDGPLTIVGVADPGIVVYVSTRQGWTMQPRVLAVGRTGPTFARAGVLDVLRRVDPLAVTLRDATMASEFEVQLRITRIFGTIIAALAGSALLLAVVGIYGVVAFGVARRTREIGIRLALGGTTREILRWITTDALRLVSIGLAIGLAVSLSVSRFLKIVLYDVSPLDPLLYGAVIVVFGAVALVACYLPARRVSKVDPLVALRAE